MGLYVYFLEYEVRIVRNINNFLESDEIDNFEV